MRRLRRLWFRLRWQFMSDRARYRYLLAQAHPLVYDADSNYHRTQ